MSEFSASHHPVGLKNEHRLQLIKLNIAVAVRVSLLACAVLMAATRPAMAQAGKLDPTFGSAGVFTDSAQEFNNTGTFGTAVALQSDGKIIAGGQIGFNTGVVRLNTNGNP